MKLGFATNFMPMKITGFCATFSFNALLLKSVGNFIINGAVNFAFVM
jgi:hypothetical protein